MWTPPSSSTCSLLACLLVDRGRWRKRCNTSSGRSPSDASCWANATLGERHPETPSTSYECGNMFIYIPGEVQGSARLQRGKRGDPGRAPGRSPHGDRRRLLRSCGPLITTSAPLNVSTAITYYHLTHAADLEVHGATHEETIDAAQNVASFEAYFAAGPTGTSSRRRESVTRP